MIIFAIDDEINSLDILAGAISEAAPDAEIRSFRRGDEAVKAAKDASCDVAFIDVEMPVMNGLEVAKRLKMVNPTINIVFATGYPEYMRDALNVRFSGYILKPVTPEKVRIELDDLRHPIAIKTDKRVRIQTFGNFEVFIDDEPVLFKYTKTKEYLAYLIHRGTLCSNSEIIPVVFGFETSSSYIRLIRKDLMDTFKSKGLGDVIVRSRGMQSVKQDMISCDYYDWRKGIPNAINSYRGEYMCQYSWAEFKNDSI